jgi:hypothetical protein
MGIASDMGSIKADIGSSRIDHQNKASRQNENRGIP